MALCIEDILSHIRSLNPSGELGREEGVLHGDPTRTVTGILVAWMPTVAAIRRAISERCEVLLSHEALRFHDYFPYASAPAPWTADRARLSLLGDGITVVRAHSTVDPLYIVPAFAQAVGLSDACEHGTVWSFHREKPRGLRRLAAQVASGLGMQALRVTGDPERTVARVGVMVGGLGLDRHLLSWERHLMGLEPDVIVAGETNDFAQRFALDSGIALIETCHSASEEPGLARLAGDLEGVFRDARIVFHKEVVPWAVL